MAEYIEREKIWPALNGACVPYNRATAKAIELIPAADVAERKHGMWQIVEKHTEYRMERCSICGFVANRTYIRDIWNFCPNCGADMRGGENG